MDCNNTAALHKLLSQMKSRLLKDLRKTQLLHCCSIFFNPPLPNHYNLSEAAGHPGRDRSSQKVTQMQWHHGESTSSHLQTGISEAGIKYFHLSLIHKYQTVKYIYIIHIMQLSFYHRALLAECTNHFDSAVMIYFISPKPPVKESLLSAV